MNKINMLVVLIAFAVLLALGSAQTNGSTASQIGRYQLLAGEHEFVGKTSLGTQKDVFRIDTVTGATSFYTVGFDKEGKPHSEWTPIR